MPKPDPRIDAYIRKSAEFAQPILTHIRAVIHEGCPDVVETMKWSMPFFDHHGPLCGFAAFKAHTALRFWKGGLVLPEGKRSSDAMGQFGRITSVADLPPRRALVALVKKAAALNQAGIAAPWMEKRAQARAARTARSLAVPADLAAALQKNRRARETFDAFSPSHKREYVEWIEGARKNDTRQRRLTTAVAQMAEGKTQNWKYERR